jgi:hypothetical protein
MPNTREEMSLISAAAISALQAPREERKPPSKANFPNQRGKIVARKRLARTHTRVAMQHLSSKANLCGGCKCAIFWPGRLFFNSAQRSPVGVDNQVTSLN